MATFLDKFFHFCVEHRWPATVVAAACWAWVFCYFYYRPEPVVYQGSYQVDCPGVQSFRIEMYLRGTAIEYTSEGQGVRFDFSQCKLELLQ